jgi:anti-sigma28 factor (negative regulator of flagellin synthesis)
MQLTAVVGLERVARSKAAVKSSSESNSSRSGSVASTSDKFETSSANKDSALLKLESIKARIRSGFYSREEVTDDVSDKLAKLFDR